MSGIGNSIETDLVGELVEVYVPRYRSNKDPEFRRVARGRVRAVTAEPSLVLWIEALDEECVLAFNSDVPRVIGEIACIHTDVGDGYARIRLIKS